MMATQQVTAPIEKVKRNSAVELLRILGMLMIVSSHCFVHGFDVPVGCEVPEYNSLLFNAGYLGGHLGNNIFILISAYFMTTMRFNEKRILRLWGTVLFYSVGILLLGHYVLAPCVPICLGDWVMCCLPVTRSAYWFVSAYIWLMLLSPVLNIIVARISAETLLKMLAVMVLWTSLAPTVLVVNFAGKLDLFIMLYLLGAYVRLHVPTEKLCFVKHALLGLAGVLVAYVCYVAAYYIGLPKGMNSAVEFSHLFTMNPSPLSVFIAFEYLLAVLALPHFYNKWVNMVAGSSLAVYLIHCHPVFKREIWKWAYDSAEHYASPWLFVYAGGGIVLVYVVCVLVDWAYQRSFRHAVYAVTDHLVLPVVRRGKAALWRGVKRAAV